MSLNLLDLSATQVLALMTKGELKSLDLTNAMLERIASEPELNTLQGIDQDQWRAQAIAADVDRAAGKVGLLTGLPFVAKDNINSASLPTSGGTTALLDHTPSNNAGVIDDLENAGAILAAKAGMHELAFGITSNNAATGPIRNPHDKTKIAGGSSGGTAAAIAAGIVPVGLGTDTGGSCRIPAALCGVTGFRPTTGRYAGSGIIPISHTRDTVGSMARCVEDIVLFDQVLARGKASPTKKALTDITLGIPRAVFYENIEPEVEAAIEAQLKTLDSAGVKLVEVDFGGIWQHNEAFSFPVVFYEVMRDLPAYLAEHAPTVTFEALIAGIKSADVAGAIGSQLGDGAMPQAAYDAAMKVHRPAMRAIYKDTFADSQLDAIIFPTTPLRARDIGQDETVELNGVQVPTFPTYIRNTDLSSNIGAPGITMPCVDVSGLPIGLELDGLLGNDDALLAVATAIEQALTR